MEEKELVVLIVEDSIDDTLLLARELKRAGYNITYDRVQTADEFKAALVQRQWQLIIADFRMPGFTGLEALQLLQASGQDIPFIIMSGAIGEEAAVEALKAGAHDFIVKGKTARLFPAIERELREAQQRIAKREIEAKYRQSEQRLRLALDATRMSVWEWDVQTNSVIYGAYYEDLFGEAYEPMPQPITNLLDRIHPEDRDRVTQAFQATLADGQPFNIEFRVVWHDDSLQWLRSQGCAFPNEQGEPVSVTGVLQNITEYKRMQEAEEEQERLQMLLDQERELTKLRNRFMLMAAHEFRTPLMGISSANEMLLTYYSQMTPDQHKEYLTEIRGRVRYLRDMLTEIESVTRDEYIPIEYSPQMTDIGALCRRVIGEIKETTRATHPIQLAIPNKLPQQNIDYQLVSHILTQLLSNAIKFSKKGSEVGLQVESDDGCLVLTVTDQGMGILPDDAGNIFDLFFRGGNIGGITGRGVGLKIVKDCVDAHGGTIEVQSETGKGSVFTVRLPV